MQSLDIIKNRIRSIETIRKITNAMKLVATAKIKKQMKIYLSSSGFCHECYSMFHLLTRDYKNFNFLLETKQVNDSCLYIAITSSLGLCGSYNSNICKKVVEKLRPNDKVIVFGKKGLSIFHAKHLENQIIDTHEYFLLEEGFYHLLPFCYNLVDDFCLGKYNRICLGYTKFVSSLKFEPMLFDILSFKNDFFETIFANKQLDKKQFANLTFEPDRRKIIRQTLPIFVLSILHGGIVESSLCENSSRRNAMDSATKNANELIEKLKITYNQARQEIITQEINEIVCGNNQNKR